MTYLILSLLAFPLIYLNACACMGFEEEKEKHESS